MNWNINKTFAAAALPLILMSSMLPAARNDRANCEPTPPATCNPDSCCRTYCMGPENYGVNAAVRPITCNGDWVITVAGFYWNAHQDGMEYAVDSQVENDLQTERVNLINATYESPDFKWDFGFKLGLGYNTTCDGWDFGVIWTRYHGKANSHVESEDDDNHTLLPIWSNFAVNSGSISLLPIYATDIETHWNLNLDLVDFELGREFWNSKRLAIRPFVGLRIAYIRQEYEIEHKGGSWSVPSVNQNNKVTIENDFKSVGIRGGLNTVWNFGCGWALYGDSAFSILYGRFEVDHDEYNRDAQTPFDKTKLLETKNSFRASRLAVDLGLGIQWSALFCDCNYGFTAKLGWENHIFLDQNQMWRVTKVSDTDDVLFFTAPLFFNDFSQRRGDLSTQGWTLTLIFDF